LDAQLLAYVNSRNQQNDATDTTTATEEAAAAEDTTTGTEGNTETATESAVAE